MVYNDIGKMIPLFSNFSGLVWTGPWTSIEKTGKWENSVRVGEGGGVKTTTKKSNITLFQKNLIYLSVITDWSISHSRSHLAGGMTYRDGKLTVPRAGKYYIYVQLYISSRGRVHVLVNDHDVITILQRSAILDATRGNGNPANAVGVFDLKAGDTISLKINSWGAPRNGSVEFWFNANHSYFGAFLI